MNSVHCLMKENARGIRARHAATCYQCSYCRRGNGYIGRCTFLPFLSTFSEHFCGGCHGYQMVKGFGSEFEGLHCA